MCLCALSVSKKGILVMQTEREELSVRGGLMET